MPLPTMWLGRQPKGWAQTMLGVPEWMSSSISAVRSHPSPILQMCIRDRGQNGRQGQLEEKAADFVLAQIGALRML